MSITVVELKALTSKMKTFSTLFQVQLSSYRTTTGRPGDETLSNLKFELNKAGFQHLQYAAVKPTDPATSLFFRNNSGDRTVSLNYVASAAFWAADFNDFSPGQDEDGHRKEVRLLAKLLGNALPHDAIHRTAPLKRGSGEWPYTERADGRICEESYTKKLFDQTSPYQRVVVAECADFGNTLILDGLENLAEGDNLYTMRICGFDDGIDYRGKTVLILGGGDGGALYEILKRSPRFVTMVEIDEVVMQACSKHLRGCCGDSMDSYRSDKHEIIVGDCLEYLNKCVGESVKFDYVISDITDIPIENKIEDVTENGNSEQKNFSETEDNGWEFFRQVYSKCLRVLANDGVILTHVGALHNRVGVERFQTEIGNLDEKLLTKMSDIWIPSFGERWVFCQIRKMSTRENEV